jgi:hypothetical protein
MSQAIAPLEHKFIKDVESIIFPDYNWRYLFERSDISSSCLMEEFENLGYPVEFMQKQITAITSMSSESLINIALSDAIAKEAATSALQVRNSRSLYKKALELLHSKSASERELGVCILTYQMGDAFRSEVEPVFYEICQTEDDDAVLEALCYAMRGLGEERIVYLKRLVGSRNADVRFALAVNFFGVTAPEGIKVLIELSDDCDAEVREWALTALKLTLLDADDLSELAYLKAVFRRRLTDCCQMVRLEAIACLAKFKDKDGLNALISELSSGDVVYLTIESATVYADPVLIPYLRKLRELLISNQELSLVEDIDIAIESCSHHCASNAEL